MRMAGQGRGALNELCACIGMLPPLSPSAWAEHNRKLASLSADVAKECGVEGKESALKRLCTALHFEVTQCAIEYYKHADKVRLYKSDKRASAVEKTRRKRKSKHRAAEEEAAIDDEGISYGAGEF